LRDRADGFDLGAILRHANLDALYKALRRISSASACIAESDSAS
jgi:hypothetical protein